MFESLKGNVLNEKNESTLEKWLWSTMLKFLY